MINLDEVLGWGFLPFEIPQADVFMYFVQPLCIVAIFQPTQVLLVLLTHLRYSLLINCNWLTKSKHTGLVPWSVNCGVINRKNVIKTSPSEMYSYGYSWWVESISPILQHHTYSFESELLITVSSGTTTNSHRFRVQFTWPILCVQFRTR